MVTNKKPLILIVDDTPQNIQVLGNILYDKGYNISISSSGVQALQSVKTKAPDLILLDIQMPGMDGFEVCKTLKANDETKEIPVIFLTAATELEKVLHGFEIGAVDYITKPFNVPELLARVATHVELKLSKEKLVEVNRAKDKFFSIIAHDLKNPANAFKYLLQQTINNYSNFSSNEIYENLVELHEASGNLYSLLENLLLWSKSQRGILTFNPEKINLKSVINKKITNCTPAAKNKKIIIKSSISNDLNVFADIMMLNTVLINLLSNAIKFTDNNGEIKVEAKTKDKFIEISIRDNGVGINKTDINKLFAIDSNVLTMGTNKEEGSGLGLILCKEFIVQNGGSIKVESEEGKGSIFSFTIPILPLL